MTPEKAKDETPEPRDRVERDLDPWKHRSDRMRCRTCMFYVPKSASNSRGTPVGRCRRHAPTMSGFPAVYPLDWCGDHKLDEERT